MLLHRWSFLLSFHPPSLTHDYKHDKAVQSSANSCPDSESDIFSPFTVPLICTINPRQCSKLLCSNLDPTLQVILTQKAYHSRTLRGWGKLAWRKEDLPGKTIFVISYLASELKSLTKNCNDSDLGLREPAFPKVAWDSQIVVSFNMMIIQL